MNRARKIHPTGPLPVIADTGAGKVYARRPFFYPDGQPVLGSFTEKREPLPEIRLPSPDHHHPVKPLRVIQDEQVQKAMVIPSRGIVVFAPSFMRKIGPWGRAFVAFHEVAHAAYREEWKCDVYGAARMLKEYGFCPLIAIEAGHLHLSKTPANNRRKNQAMEWIIRNGY